MTSLRNECAQACVTLTLHLGPNKHFIFLSLLTDPSLGLMAWNQLSWEESFPGILSSTEDAELQT